MGRPIAYSAATAKSVGVVKLDAGSTILGRNEDLQNIFIEGANFYSKT